MTSPVGSLSLVTFTDEVTVTPERLPPPALRERNSRADWPELRDDRLKVEIFQLRAVNASPTSRRPGTYRVYHSHTRLYVDFSWDSVARKNSFAFGANAPWDESSGRLFCHDFWRGGTFWCCAPSKKRTSIAARCFGLLTNRALGSRQWNTAAVETDARTKRIQPLRE